MQSYYVVIFFSLVLNVIYLVNFIYLLRRYSSNLF